MTELAFRSASELSRLLDSRKLCARELLEHYWSRHEQFNSALNAIIVTDIERARREADESDSRRDRGEPRGPLDGLPMTIKESFNVTGLPTTWGVSEYRDNIATTDAVVVHKLRAVGALIFGKTNVPRYLADWQSFNDIYGTTNNPWNLALSPGGSSGGAAAALAAGLTALEFGSDIGASIRNPAHYCGVYGHKPTHRIVCDRGEALPGMVADTDISVVGPLARSAHDLSFALRLAAGSVGPEARGWNLKLPESNKNRLKDFKLAIVLTDPVSEVDQPVQDLIVKLADFLGHQGATVHNQARPDFDTRHAHNIYISLLRAATSPQLTSDQFSNAIARCESFDSDDKGYLANMLRGNTMRHREWLAINNERHRLMLKWEDFFRNYDLLLCPVAASAAFPHDQGGERYERTITINGRQHPTTNQLFWAGYSGCYYLPGTSAPIGLTPSGLPVGIQIVGPRYGDLTCIRFAELLEQEYYCFVPPPGYA